MRRHLLFAILAAGLAAAPAARAWGPTGHRIVGAVAETHLSPATAETARAILRGVGLPQIATWPDEIRSDPSWSCSAPFHFTTIRPGAPYPHATVAEGDAAQALVYYTDRLRDAATEPAERRIALAFVTHLVGDLHQPLHNGLGCDRGGNMIDVDWFGARMSLHEVWDEGVIEKEGLSYSEFATFLVEAERARPTHRETPSPLDWIEAGRVFMPGVYSCDLADGCVCYSGDCPNGLSPFAGCGTLITALKPESLGAVPKLGYRYQFRALPVVRGRLTAAGRRLAAHLDWALDPSAQPPAEWAAFADAVRAMPGWNAAVAACRGDSTP